MRDEALLQPVLAGLRIIIMCDKEPPRLMSDGDMHGGTGNNVADLASLIVIVAVIANAPGGISLWRGLYAG